MTGKFLKRNILNARRYLSDTSFKTKWLFLRRRLIKIVNPWVPQKLWIGVTYRCQCECVHCCVGPYLNAGGNELTRDEVRSAITEARKMGFLEVTFFGGEPLLCRDLTGHIRYASSIGLMTSLYTNGILLTRERVRELREAGLSFCNVSLDSSSADRHDSLRNYSGGFKAATEGIRNLVDAGIRCSIWSYVSKRDVADRDLKDLRELIAVGRRLKVKKVVILFPIASGNWFCSKEDMLTMEERERVRTLFDPPFVILEFPDEETDCPAGKGLAYINPYGDVSPCPAVPFFFGNVRQEALSDILKKVNGDFVKLEKGCGECIMNNEKFRHTMAQRDSLKGGCKAFTEKVH
ncbi:MAG: radical SAM protein [Deltaproteobacteria bacterium]|nr:radical SAM protein [Deltaproteobacteria bacterium]